MKKGCGKLKTAIVKFWLSNWQKRKLVRTIRETAWSVALAAKQLSQLENDHSRC